MLNIEKYKDDILNAETGNITCCVYDDILHLDCIGNCVECKKNVMKWLLEEYKEPVLDDVERKYLSEVIRPFRKKITHITKTIHYGTDKQYISITTKGKDGFIDSLNFPNFENDTMYKGMKINRKYTLEELGL